LKQLLRSLNPNQPENEGYSSGNTLSASYLVDSKYYFAGGSSRFMFHIKTEKVIETLVKALSCVSSLRDLIDFNVGDRSNNVFNRFFGLYPGKYKSRQRVLASRVYDKELL
jgi:hypothetical protein